jgi:hypothetical protein
VGANVTDRTELRVTGPERVQSSVLRVEIYSASHSRVVPENVGLQKERKRGCVFWEFAKRKLATRKDSFCKPTFSRATREWDSLYNLHDECHYHISTTHYLASNYIHGFHI